MRGELEHRLRQIRLLRRIREAEQFRLAAELRASQRRMHESAEAGEDAGRYLDGDLTFGGLFASQGLQVATRSAIAVAEERRSISELSERNASSMSATDTLADTERRQSVHLEAYLSNSVLMEVITSRPPREGEE